MKRVFFAIVLVGVVTLHCAGQQLPRYTQYMFDPYLLNPALVAREDRPEANLLYNRQWSGITNGPQTLQADIQYPFSPRIAAGITIFEDRTVILSRTSVMATFGYKVPLSENQLIGFGLSGGFFSNRIRLEDIADGDAHDPALYSYANNRTRFESQFGTYYRFKELIVGFSLLQLVNDGSYSAETIRQPSFSPFDNMVVHASWQFPLSDEVGLLPNVVYRFNTHDRNAYDASLLFSFKNTVAVGGGYHQYLGSNIITRVMLENFGIGYAFGLGAAGAASAFGSTNEIQLTWRFGEKVAKKEDTPHIDSDSDIYKDYTRKLRRIEHQKRKYRNMVE